jgi:hypothetical protein
MNVRDAWVELRNKYPNLTLTYNGYLHAVQRFNIPYKDVELSEEHVGELEKYFTMRSGNKLQYSQRYPTLLEFAKEVLSTNKGCDGKTLCEMAEFKNAASQSTIKRRIKKFFGKYEGDRVYTPNDIKQILLNT